MNSWIHVVNTLPKESDLKRFFLEVSGISPVTCTWGRLVNVSAGNFQISSVEYNQSTLRSSTVLHQALITFSSEKRRQPEICKNEQRSLCACESIRVFYSYFTRQQEPKHLDAFTGYAYHYTHYMGYWLSERLRWLDIGQVLFWLIYGPRRSRGL